MIINKTEISSKIIWSWKLSENLIILKLFLELKINNAN